jgi:hypothetical protein
MVIAAEPAAQLVAGPLHWGSRPAPHPGGRDRLPFLAFSWLGLGAIAADFSGPGGPALSARWAGFRGPGH